MPRQPQVSATVSDELYAQLIDIAIRDKRPLSQSVALLLEQAVKERNRKKKNNGPAPTTEE